MPENEFEKQVQQKMSELRFVPSAAVWDEVEKQIPNAKKRRNLLVWLLLLLLLSGAGWFYAYNGKNKTNSIASPVQEKTGKSNNEPVTIRDNSAAASNPDATAERKDISKNTTSHSPVQDKSSAGAQPVSAETKSGDAIVARGGNNTVSNNMDEKTAVTTKAIAKENAIRAAAGKSSNHRADASVVPSKVKSNRRNKLISAQPTPSASDIATNKKTGDASDATPDLPGSKTALATKETAFTDHPDGETAEEPFVKAYLMAPATAASIKANAVEGDAGLLVKKENEINAAEMAEKAKLASNKKKMMWGIVAGGGVSNVSKGLSLFSPAPVQDARNYSFSQPNGNINTGGSNTSNTFSLTDVKPGAAFSAGVFIQQPSKTNWRFFAGIHYAYFSTKISVGRKVDSSSSVSQNGLDKSISGYYQPASVGSSNSSYNYTNHYHFIGISPGVEKQLGRKSKFAFNAGLTVSRLISSNGLQYDLKKNIYYQDNSIFNKTQAGLFAGFNYQLLQKSAILTIGPQFSYSLTNLYKNDDYGNRHFFFASITARLFFHRK